jgi:hypothetical protein
VLLVILATLSHGAKVRFEDHTVVSVRNAIYRGLVIEGKTNHFLKEDRVKIFVNAAQITSYRETRAQR